MKPTPQITPATTNTNADSQTAKGTTSTGKIGMTPGEPIPVSDLIKQAHAQADKKTETPAPAEQKPYPVAEPKPEPAPAAPVQVAPKPESAPVSAAPVRSRSEEIDYQIKKAQTMQVINSQLQSLKEKLGELNQFSYGVDKDDDRNYGRVVIYDDNNREFVCRNHGVAALIVANLKSVFSEKVEEKESEFLTVSRS